MVAWPPLDFAELCAAADDLSVPLLSGSIEFSSSSADLCSRPVRTAVTLPLPWRLIGAGSTAGDRPTNFAACLRCGRARHRAKLAGRLSWTVRLRSSRSWVPGRGNALLDAFVFDTWSSWTKYGWPSPSGC